MEQLKGIPLSEAIKNVIRMAQSIAKENMYPEFAPAHILKALLYRETGLQTLLNKLTKGIYYLEQCVDEVFLFFANIKQQKIISINR